MGYVEAIVQQEAVLAQELPPTLPPASTMAKGQTPHAVNMHYPQMPERCPHLVEHGRRYGNARGKFLECVNCGSVWKGLDYVVPITNELVTTYKTFLGLRDRPGGKVMKGVQTRRTFFYKILCLLIFLTSNVYGSSLWEDSSYIHDINAAHSAQDQGQGGAPRREPPLGRRWIRS